MSIDDVLQLIKDGKKKSSDALALWKTYRQTYYHELNHFAGLVNDTDYYDVPEGTPRVPDQIYPYYIKNQADLFGTKGSFYKYAPKLYFSTMYLAVVILCSIT